MTTPKINVDVESMSQAHQAFANAGSDFQTQQGQVNASLQNLESALQSQSGTTYQQGMQEWQQGFTQVINAVEWFASQLVGGGNLYTESESSNAATAAKIPTGLPNF